MGSSRTSPLARSLRRRRPPLIRKLSKTALPVVGRAQPSLPASLAKGVTSAAKRPPWKLVGLAGIAGVAATGVVVARKRRAHRELAPDELRERLHRRLAEVGSEPAAKAGADDVDAPPLAPE